MKIKIVATTDTGRERANNEDAYIICPDLSQQDWSQKATPSYIPLNEYGSIMVVADGMGGANAGEVAASIATETIKRFFSKDRLGKLFNEKTTDIPEFLSSCIKEADDAINQRIDNDPDTAGMGTTIVVCWILNQMAYIAWCGDSRCYIFNPNNGLRQLTKDHSFVQELIDKGEITEEEAFSHPDNNIITRGLGDVESQAMPEIIKHPIAPSDVILLCSDGLCGYCTNKDIELIVENNYIDIMKCRDELLKYALDVGGYDNICIVLASMIDNEQNEPLTISSKQTNTNRLIRFLKRYI